MPTDLNDCKFIGRLGADPEIKYLPSGSPVANLNLAVNRTWKDKETGERKEQVTWVPIVYFGRLAEVAGEYLKKGSQIMAGGRFQKRKWQDKDGNDRWATDIICDQLQMLDGRGDRQEGATTNPGKPEPAGDDMDDDDIPF
ncbi:MAG: single-stranded DNA-binding protein [Salinisphaeraceae bacterium]